MHINKLSIENVRNIKHISIPNCDSINVFVGDNGAGKTSILEALYIASIGRSFRHQQIKPMLNKEAHFLRVFLECTDDKGLPHKVGIERNHKNDYQIKIDGQKVTSLAQLSLLLPLIVIDSTSFTLLDGSSSERRKFLDWGVFHVEHQFYSNWRHYSKILKQRNVLLRQKPSSYQVLKPWDSQFADYAVTVERSRLSYLANFSQAFTDVLEELDPALAADTSLLYKNGWGAKFNISDKNEQITELNKEKVLQCLQDNFNKDCKYQRTVDGSHRADMQLFTHKQLIKDCYSRGQKKTVVSALKLAQAKLVADISNKQPVILLDDMPSELDKNHLRNFFSYLSSMHYQLFITAVDQASFDGVSLEASSMFHVEHGEIIA